MLVIDPDIVKQAVTFLVTSFMPLKEKDLQEWMTDPEEFVNVEDQDDIQWQFQIRVRTVIIFAQRRC